MKAFLIFSLLSSSVFVQAQQPGGIPQPTNAPQKGSGKISGTILDTTTQQPVEFATVALALPGSDKPVDGSVCDDKGKFSIHKVPNGTYRLIISFIGYENLVVEKIVISDKQNSVDLGTLKMTYSTTQLQEVVVQGQKVLVEEKVDRTVYNAENDETARGGDATDVLKRVPMLSVDMDGNVSLRGNQNIRVLINNKPSTITASSVADALKQIPADQIKTVEVITSPSAKYDAEGSAGIINIITKKNTLQGLTLNVDGSAGYRGSNLGLNGNYRKGKMGFSLGGNTRAGYNVVGKFSNSQLTTAEDKSQSLNLQSANTRSANLFGNTQFGWDYDIDKNNSLAASIRYGARNGFNNQDNLNTEIYKYDVLTGSSLRNVETEDKSGTIDASLNYTHIFKPQREFSLMAVYSKNDRTNDFLNAYVSEEGVPTSKQLKNENKSFNEEITVQADYQTPIGTTQLLEFGGKLISRKVASDYKYFSAPAEGDPFVPLTNSNLANVFNYNQKITSGYLSYTYSSKSGYSIKAGSRYEYTTINANFAVEKAPVVIPSYGVLVPSINISKKLGNGGTLKAAYNRRIQRPSIQFLNPNIQASNPFSVSYGNPNLGPEYTNNYELSYSTFIKGTTLNFSTFVRNTDDAIQRIRDVRGDTIVTTYQNIGREDAYGGSVFVGVNISNKFTLNGGTDVYYAVLNNNDPNPNYTASNKGWVASGRLFGNYTLGKGWGIQFFSFVRGRQVQLQGFQGGMYMYGMSFRKELPNKKGSIGLGTDQFLTPVMRIDNSTFSPVIEQKSTNELHNFNIRVTFSYRIGKMTYDAPRKRRKSVNNDDLKDEGDGGGMGGDQQQGAQGGAQGGQRNGAGPVTGAAAAAKANPKDSVKTVTPAADPNAVVNAEGRWTYTVESPQGASGTLTIKKTGDTYSGSIINSRNNRETVLKSVTVTGNELNYSYDVSFGGNTSTISVKSIIDGDSMKGTMTSGFGSFPMSAKRGQ